MKLLMLSWEYPPNVVGGLGRHVAELAPALAQQGVDIHVVTPVATEFAEPVACEGTLTVHRVHTPVVNADNNIYDRVVEANQKIEHYVNQLDESFDLIHVHDWLTGFAGIDLQQAWHCPLLATIHATERGRGRGYIGNDLQRAIDNAERDLIQQATHLIVCSHYMSHEVQSFFHTSPRRIDVVPNGVNIADLNNHCPENNLVEFKARYADPDDLIIFTVTRLVYEKGVHRLVEAAPQIFAECPTARLIIAGKGPEAEHLKQQAAELGLSDRINFAGFISDEERNCFYKTAACAVFPSLYEPFGIVALEAMALRCPVVVSDVGGLSEIVNHGENGVTIYPDDAESAAWGVLRMLQNPDWARKHADNGYHYVDQLFNWPRIARLTRAVYRRLLNKAPLRSTNRHFI